MTLKKQLIEILHYDFDCGQCHAHNNGGCQAETGNCFVQKQAEAIISASLTIRLKATLEVFEYEGGGWTTCDIKERCSLCKARFRRVISDNNQNAKFCQFCGAEVLYG